MKRFVWVETWGWICTDPESLKKYRMEFRPNKLWFAKAAIRLNPSSK